MPNITNQGINPANNLLMQLKQTIEHSNADCVQTVQHVTEQASGGSATANAISVILISAFKSGNYGEKIKCFHRYTKQCILKTKGDTWLQQSGNCLLPQTSLL